jgi:hypothetical protein
VESVTTVDHSSFDQVYQEGADKYELLVNREDYENNILKSIREILQV